MTRLGDLLPGLRSVLVDADLSYGSGRQINCMRTSKQNREREMNDCWKYLKTLLESGGVVKT
jgi:hypothetical protein